ncbi:MAG TPA: hypothetical protein VJT31_30415 [Rugosimonospora sp.]|nr:hypothetical protein [Rugosimonospora sp.]
MNRTGRLAVLTAAVAGIGAFALPAAAHADSYTGQFLGTGQSACVSQYASYQVRVDGTASNMGAKFRVYRNGVQIAASPTDTTAGYAAEFRSSWGNFPGAGYYTLCALNKQSTNSFVTVRVRGDAEI